MWESRFCSEWGQSPGARPCRVAQQQARPLSSAASCFARFSPGRDDCAALSLQLGAISADREMALCRVASPQPQTSAGSLFLPPYLLRRECSRAQSQRFFLVLAARVRKRCIRPGKHKRTRPARSARHPAVEARLQHAWPSSQDRRPLRKAHAPADRGGSADTYERVEWRWVPRIRDEQGRDAEG